MILRPLYGLDRSVATAIARMIPHCDPAGFTTAIATLAIVDDKNILRAGIVYYNHNRAAGTLDMAAGAMPKTVWLTRPVIQAAFDAAFRGFFAQMVVMRTADRRLTDRLADFGFDVIHIPRLYGRDVDGQFCTLTVETWAKHPINRNPEAVRQQEAA